MESIKEAELVITLMIFVKEGKEQVFLDYEEKALPFLDKYHGKLEYRLRPDENSFVAGKNPKPYEIHMVSFKTIQDFQMFSRDQERLLMADMYHDSVETTIMIQGQAL